MTPRLFERTLMVRLFAPLKGLIQPAIDEEIAGLECEWDAFMQIGTHSSSWSIPKRSKMGTFTKIRSLQIY